MARHKGGCAIHARFDINASHQTIAFDRRGIESPMTVISGYNHHHPAVPLFAVNRDAGAGSSVLRSSAADHFGDVAFRRFPEGFQFAVIASPRDPITVISPPPRDPFPIPSRGRCNHSGLASSLRLVGRLGDESTRNTAAGWPDLINRSHALPADKWWAGG